MGDEQATGKSWLADASLVGAIVLAAVRCLVTFEAQALGSPDAAPIGVGPAGKLVADALCVLPLLGALAYRRRSKLAIAHLPLLLWAVAPWVAFVLVRSQGGPPLDWASVAHWWSALALGLAAMHTVDTPDRRKLLLVVAAGLLFAMSVSAIHQVTVQHDDNVAFYEQNRQQFLEQRGWPEGSREQIKYETRLYQRESSGAFGLSNVFGSVLATLVCIAGGLALSVPGSRLRWMGKAGVIALFALGFVALLTTKSKGAALALLLGGAAVTTAWWFGRRFDRPVACARCFAFGVVVLALAALAVRFAMGPPDSVEGERSLLFRACYLQASMRMVAAEPLVGVGDFQQAYLRYKNPLNPEDVSDPHHFAAMWIASIGIAGWLWTAVVVMWLWRAAGNTARREPGATASQGITRRAAACAALVFGFQWWMQVLAVGRVAESSAELIPVAVYVALAPGLAAAVTVMLAALVGRRVDDSPAMAWGLFAAAVVIVLHGQIEMNLTNHMSAPLLCVLLGGAAALWRNAMTSVLRTAFVLIVTAVLSLAAAAMIADAARHMHAELHARKAMHVRYRAEGFSPRLLDAVRAHPLHHKIMLTVLLDGAQQAHDTGNDAGARELLKAAGFLNGPLIHQYGRSIMAYRAGLRINAARYRMFGAADDLDGAVQSGKFLLERAPYSLDLHLRTADTLWELGEREHSSQWYARALEIDQLSYLDPDSQLTDADRQRVTERLAATANQGTD